MAQWSHMTQLIQYLPHETTNNLYPSNTFPIEVRHFLCDWIEKQRWEDFTPGNVEQEAMAQGLLNELIMMLQTLAHSASSVVDKMKLMQISKEMNNLQPLQFVVIVRDMLRMERDILNKYPRNSPPPPQIPQNTEPSFASMQDVDQMVLKVYEVQETRQKMHQLQEELNWEKQNFEAVQGTSHQNGLDSTNTEAQKLQNRILELKYNVNTMATKHFQLLQQCVDCLEQCQKRLISRLKAWRCEQHKATIGHPFDDNLNPLQTWCEQLLVVNGKLRQEVMLLGERQFVSQLPELMERLGQLLQVLIQSSLVVDKQPPQVIKTQSKFSTTVRYLLGEKVAPGKPVVLKAQIITELQARSLGQQGNAPSDSVGDLINNNAILEHNTSSKSMCATFRNMSIKKIKRADRKGSESVTEEKFALLFSTEITITGCDTPYRIQMISVPLVVIVHGSQDSNALATVIWDCAFSEPDRVPFVVPERVPWRMMCSTLNSKFTSEVGTSHELDQYNQHFLAQKIFDKPDVNGDFSNTMVSWAQFNKEVLPGRQFTFWQWFEGVMELTKKHLKMYWSEGLIFGFIGKQHLHLILQQMSNGTFLLRFSDSEIGGITIAYVSATENGGQKIQNIQPFSKRDLEIRCLGDRIQDINNITHLYPNCPKNDVFKKYFTDPQTSSTGYIPVRLETRVQTESAPQPVPNMVAPVAESPHTFPMESASQPVPNMVAPVAESPRTFPVEPASQPVPNMVAPVAESPHTFPLESASQPVPNMVAPVAQNPYTFTEESASRPGPNMVAPLAESPYNFTVESAPQPVPNMVAPVAENPYPFTVEPASQPVPNMVAPVSESRHTFPLPQYQQPFSPQDGISQGQITPPDFTNSAMVFAEEMASTTEMEVTYYLDSFEQTPLSMVHN